MALVDRIPFTKIVTVLAICACLAVGLCGVGLAMGGGMDRMGWKAGTFVMSAFMIPGGVMFWASLIGLILLFPLWLVLSIVKAVSSR